MQNNTERERNITLRLLFEFKVICHTYSLELTPPVFELFSNKHSLGRWNGESRTISINKKFIESTTWENIIEVLKHEMAHQLCSELLYSDKRSHGEEFHNACDMLMVKQAFRKSSINIETFQGNANITEKDNNPKLQKVFKLLDLSRSTNVFEAEVAFSKAQQMMQKYNFTESDLNLSEVVKHKIINLEKKQVKRYQARIAGILSKYFYVEVIRAETYDQKSNNVYKTFEIIGREGNVDIALHCYYFLNNRLEKLWVDCDVSNKKGNTLRLKNSFYLGVLDGVEKKIVSDTEGKVGNSVAQEKLHHSSSEVLVLNDVAVQSYIKKRYPNLRKRKNRVLNIDALMYKAGASAGKNISLHKAIMKGNGKMKFITS